MASVTSVVAGPSPALLRPVRTLAIAFTVWGEPIPQGSHKAFVVGKRAIVTDDNPRLKAWRRHVAAVAKTAAGTGWTPLDCPLAIRLDFTMPKPASYPKRRRTWPSASADLDKACRAIWDSLTTAGVITNDARFVELRAAKHFPGEHDDALAAVGVRVAIWTLTEPAQPTLELSPAFPTACAETPSKEGASSDPTNDRRTSRVEL